jgi:phosphoribosylaminoimidazolecarboxamide formyltransferase/IMP cyclohydrolase
MGGRVKTLHPHIHAGILADKDDPEHMDTLEHLGIKAFDLVLINLYDFASAVQNKAGMREAVESIDIGGPCLLRAAAKNFHSVLVVPGPEHYERVKIELADKGFAAGLSIRQDMAEQTFEITSRYDAMISEYMGGQKA